MKRIIIGLAAAMLSLGLAAGDDPGAAGGGGGGEAQPPVAQ